MLAHNGEINTLRGNISWMVAREATFSSPLFGDDMPKLFPVITPGQSDTASIDNALELLLATGRSLPHCMMMLVPEAWSDGIYMDPEKRAFYNYHSSPMEPWDGLALLVFTDGVRIGAILDRTGLRPFRYLVTKDDTLVMASEVGVLDIPPEDVMFKARVQPGRMFLIDPSQGWITAQVPERRTGKRVAVVGSGPAGLAAAQQLNRAGHHITVFERDERPGGLLVFGIPDFKLEKSVVNRRIALMEQEGVEFRTGVNVGIDYPVEDLRAVFDAVCLCGARPKPGRWTSPGVTWRTYN